ncbi:MAG: hypothetical protein ABIR59_05700 [Gemmatimonadales bacterium]
MNTRQIALAAMTLAGAVTACGSTMPDGSGSVALFASLPLAADRVACVHPLGEVVLPGQVIGANLSRWDVHERGACGAPMPFTGGPVPVVAAARGTVVTVGGADGRTVTIAVSENIEYTYTGVALDGFIREGTVVPAGQRLGLVADPDSGIGFGITDFTRVNAWIATPRYPDSYRHARHPVEFYGGALLTQVVSRMGGLPAPAGRLVWDTDGRLSGNWFREFTPRTAQAVTAPWWDGHLSFRGDARFPDQPRVGLGTLLGGGCKCAPRAGESVFGDVTPQSGPVAYHLVRVRADGTVTTEYFGTLLVELLASDRLRVELFAGDVTAPTFTAAAENFVR